MHYHIMESYALTTFHRRIRDADSGQCLKTLVDDDSPHVVCVTFEILAIETPSQDYSSHISFTPKSRYVLASTQDSTIRLWNYQSSRCVKTYTGHTNRTYSLVAAFSTIVSRSEDAKIYMQSRRIAQILEGWRH